MLPRDLISGEEIDSIAKKFSHIIKIHPSSDGTHPTWTGRWWLTLREEKELKNGHQNSLRKLLIF